MSDFERPNIVTIQGGGKPDELNDTLRKLQKSLPNLLELTKLNAQITRSKFEALKAQGFTDAQALELCK